MSGKQVGEILLQARQFHQDLSAFFGALEKVADRERVKMLLSYFSHRETALQESLKSYEESIGHEVLTTWYKFPPEAEGLCQMDSLKLAPAMTVDQVVEAALTLDDCLMRMYRGAAENAPTVEVREVFQNLIKLSERERDRLKEQGEAVKDL